MFRSTRSAFLEHERAKVELKGLMPEDAKEAIGHGVRAKRSKSGAISFDLLDMEAGNRSSLSMAGLRLQAWKMFAANMSEEHIHSAVFGLMLTMYGLEET